MGGGDNVVGIETSYGLDDWRFDSQWGKGFSFRYKLPRPALEPTQSPLVGISQGVLLTTHPHLAPGLGHSRTLVLTPLCAFMERYRENFTFIWK
jgi:hypothetical protein